jgi:hypothetical protein
MWYNYTNFRVPKRGLEETGAGTEKSIFKANAVNAGKAGKTK